MNASINIKCRRLYIRFIIYITNWRYINIIHLPNKETDSGRKMHFIDLGNALQTIIFLGIVCTGL